MAELKIEYLSPDELKPYSNNAKEHPAAQIEQIKRSIIEFGFKDPIAIWNDNEVIEGHGRLMAALEMGIKSIPVIRLDDLTDEQRRAYMLVHNKLTMNSDFNVDLLSIELDDITNIDMGQFGFDIDLDDEDYEAEEPSGTSLVDKFGIPPFSIIDTRQGYYQERKKAWRDIGIKSETGRESTHLGNLDAIDEKYGNTSNQIGGISIFDPALCEIMYKWYCPTGGLIYDCFAGGSVRGVVAEYLKYKYIGIELRREQCEANEIEAEKIGVSPTWINDDSTNADNYIEDESCDMLFTCPPYADLEVYSDDARDISNMDYKDFCVAYEKILSIAIRKLKNDRFGVIVIGDVRDKNGFYRGLTGLTKDIFRKNGVLLYNELIMVDAVGTAAVRASKLFNASRKVVKTHQNVLVFYKGNPKNIKNVLPAVDFSGVDGMIESDVDVE